MGLFERIQKDEGNGKPAARGCMWRTLLEVIKDRLDQDSLGRTRATITMGHPSTILGASTCWLPVALVEG